MDDCMVCIISDKLDDDFLYNWYRVLYNLFYKQGLRLYHTASADSLCLQVSSCFTDSWRRDGVLWLWLCSFSSRTLICDNTKVWYYSENQKCFATYCCMCLKVSSIFGIIMYTCIAHISTSVWCCIGSKLKYEHKYRKMWIHKYIGTGIGTRG